MPFRSSGLRVHATLLAVGALLPLAALLVRPPVTPDLAGGDLVLVQDGEVVNEDLYAAGNRVLIEGTVEGDVLVAAFQELVVSGTVEGSITGVASTVTITGNVEGSVRMAAGTVKLEGNVGKDLFVAASSTSVTGTVGRDLIFYGGDLATVGQVARNVRGQTLDLARIGGSVGGDVDMTVARMEVLDRARIGGTLGYRSANDADIGRGVEVGRTIVHRQPVRPNVRVQGLLLLTQLVLLLTMVIFGYLMFWTAPAATATAVDAVRRRPLSTMLIGIGVAVVPVGLFVTAMVAVVSSSPELLLPAILVGGPIGTLLFGLLGVGSLLAPVPVLTAVGDRILRGRRSPQAAFTVGLVIWLVVLGVPIVGPLVALAVSALGLGGWTVGLFAGRTAPPPAPVASRPAVPQPAVSQPAATHPDDAYPLPPLPEAPTEDPDWPGDVED